MWMLTELSTCVSRVLKFSAFTVQVPFAPTPLKLARSRSLAVPAQGGAPALYGSPSGHPAGGGVGFGEQKPVDESGAPGRGPPGVPGSPAPQNQVGLSR